jgi:hypothetical protein
MGNVCKFCECVFATPAELSAHQTLTGHRGQEETDDGYSLKDVLIFGVGAVSGKEKKKAKGKRFAWSWRA